MLRVRLLGRLAKEEGPEEDDGGWRVGEIQARLEERHRLPLLLRLLLLVLFLRAIQRQRRWSPGLRLPLLRRRRDRKLRHPDPFANRLSNSHSSSSGLHHDRRGRHRSRQHRRRRTLPPSPSPPPPQTKAYLPCRRLVAHRLLRTACRSCRRCPDSPPTPQQNPGEPLFPSPAGTTTAAMLRFRAAAAATAVEAVGWAVGG